MQCVALEPIDGAFGQLGPITGETNLSGVAHCGLTLVKIDRRLLEAVKAGGERERDDAGVLVLVAEEGVPGTGTSSVKVACDVAGVCCS